MINNRRYVSHATGADVYALVRDAGSGNIWNTDGTPAFEAYSAANYGDYAITCTEHGASGTYEFTMPSAIPDGVYDIEFRAQDGASPAEGDTFIDAGIAAWVDGENTFRTTWNTNATELDGDPVDTLLEKTEKAQYDLISAESVGSTSILVDEAPQFPVPGDFLVFQRPGTPMALSTAVCTGAEEDGDDVRIHFLPALDVALELTEPDTVIVMAPRAVPRTHSANAAEAGDAMALVDNAISAGKIATGALTAAKFASGAFDAVWSVAARTLTAFGFTVTTDSASREASKADVSDIPKVGKTTRHYNINSGESEDVELQDPPA